MRHSAPVATAAPLGVVSCFVWGRGSKVAATSKPEVRCWPQNHTQWLLIDRRCSHRPQVGTSGTNSTPKVCTVVDKLTCSVLARRCAPALWRPYQSTVAISTPQTSATKPLLHSLTPNSARPFAFTVVTCAHVAKGMYTGLEPSWSARPQPLEAISAYFVSKRCRQSAQ